MDPDTLLNLPNEKLVSVILQLSEENARYSRNIAYIVDQWKLHTMKTNELQAMYQKLESERDVSGKEMTELKHKLDRTSVLLDLTERARNNLELTNKKLRLRIEEAKTNRGDSSLSISEEDDREAVLVHPMNENCSDVEKQELRSAVRDLKVLIEKKDLDISHLKGSILRLKGSVKGYQSFKDALEKRVAVMESACSSQSIELQALRLEIEGHVSLVKKVFLEKKRLEEEIERLSGCLEKYHCTKEIVGMQSEEMITLRQEATVAQLEYRDEKLRLLAQLNASRPEDSRRIRELQFELIAAKGHQNHWKAKVSCLANVQSYE